MTSFVPRYSEIEQALRARVAELRPGDIVPSDTELCEEFGVSRQTARNAMQRLQQEGLVQRMPGRGTFVAERPIHRQAGSLISFSDEMRRKGRRPTSRVLRRALRPATPDEARQLGAAAPAPGAGGAGPGGPGGGEVFGLVRLRLADEEPIAIEASAFPAGLAETLAGADLETGSLFEALVAAGRVPTAGRAELRAGAATAEDSPLELAVGAALLIERRLIFDQAGRPLELTESRYAAERYSLEVSFDVELA
jgi:GntR family transcriptional regulator